MTRPTRLTESLALALVIGGVALPRLVRACLSSQAPVALKEQAPETGVATLFALDPLSQTFSFKDGLPGKAVQDHRVVNRQSDIDFGNYHAGEFTVGIEGSVQGAIVDLGSVEELRERYGYTETVGGGQGFASIRREGESLVILKDYREHLSSRSSRPRISSTRTRVFWITCRSD